MKIILHNAISLDGKVDGFEPSLKLYYEVIKIWKEDAVLMGSETCILANTNVVAENDLDFGNKEKINIKDKRPTLIIPDSQGKIKFWHMLKRSGYWKDFLVLCSQSTPQDYIQYLTKRNIKFIIAGDQKVYFKKALGILSKDYNINTIRVDGGGTLNSILLEENLIDEISLLIHPVIVGGTSVMPFFKNLNNIKLKFLESKIFETGITWLRYTVIK